MVQELSRRKYLPSQVNPGGQRWDGSGVEIQYHTGSDAGLQ